MRSISSIMALFLPSNPYLKINVKEVSHAFNF